jgi:hypothetical protein
MNTYYTQEGRIVYIAKASFTSDYTFYIRDANNLKQRGTRVRGKTQKLYFPTITEAENALSEYAKKRGWKRA